jgi:hypothetical protein
MKGIQYPKISKLVTTSFLPSITKRRRFNRVRIITFNVDKATMDVGTTLKIEVLEVDKMCKTLHASSCDQIAISKAQQCQICKS